jgi:hypothetical protein
MTTGVPRSRRAPAWRDFSGPSRAVLTRAPRHGGHLSHVADHPRCRTGRALRACGEGRGAGQRHYDLTGNETLARASNLFLAKPAKIGLEVVPPSAEVCGSGPRLT